MRIIEADALKDRLQEALDFQEKHDNYEGAELFEIAQDIVDEQPTIDAIPVGWLNKQCEMADDRGDMEMTDAISWLIQTWQEEQEAQDGKA